VPLELDMESEREMGRTTVARPYWTPIPKRLGLEAAIENERIWTKGGVAALLAAHPQAARRRNPLSGKIALQLAVEGDTHCDECVDELLAVFPDAVNDIDQATMAWLAAANFRFTSLVSPHCYRRHQRSFVAVTTIKAPPSEAALLLVTRTRRIRSVT
jgi:hypothetical protein